MGNIEDQNTQPDILSMDALWIHKTKNEFKLKRCQVIISLCFLAVSPHITESLELQYFPNQYFIIMEPGFTF